MRYLSDEVYNQAWEKVKADLAKETMAKAVKLTLHPDVLKDPNTQVRICTPHPAEATKRERIEEESRLKGVDPDNHPGWRMYLCNACGVWHPNLPAPGKE